MPSPETAQDPTPRYDLKNDLGWILDQLVDGVPQARHAVLLAGDGLRTAHSRDISAQSAETLAAVASGIHSLARSYGQKAMPGEDGEWLESVNSFRGGYLMIVSAGRASYLAIDCGTGVDLGALTTQAHSCVLRLGEHLDTPLRGAAGGRS